MARQCAICGIQIKIGDPRLQIYKAFLCQCDGYTLCRALGYQVPPTFMEVGKLALITAEYAKETVSNYNSTPHEESPVNKSMAPAPTPTATHTPVDPAQITFRKQITFVSGKKEIQAPGMFNLGKLFQLQNGTVMFTTKTPYQTFHIISMKFDGPNYHEETKTQTKGETKKKRHGLAGAVIGGVLTGGVGAIAGGVAGHGMGKDKISSNTNSRTLNVEDPSRLTLELEELSTGNKFVIVLAAYQKDFDKMRNLQIFPKEGHTKPKPQRNAKNPEPSDSNNLEEQLAKYKSLLDKQLITQEDYEAKKKQLLGL